MASNLKAIRKELKANKFSGIIIPKWDEFRSENVAAADDYLAWSSGFKGSYGVAFVSPKQAILFVDGRYTLQASYEAPEFEIISINNMKEWIITHATGEIVFDPWLWTEEEIQSFQTDRSDFFPLTDFFERPWPVDKRPKKELMKITYYPLSGQSSFDKRMEVAKHIKPHDFLLLTSPDSVSWLLNIRDTEREFTPVVNAYALVSSQGLVELFVDGEYKDLFDGVMVFEKNVLIARLMGLKNSTVIISPKASFIVKKALQNHVIGTNPIEMMKACKNEVELQYIRLIHRRDGAALSEFLTWLEMTDEPLSEISVRDSLLEFRKLQRHFMKPSFPSIVGAKEHSAIIHYQPTEESNYAIEDGDVLLIDSGGQYWGGTTDVTRTLVIGSAKKSCHYFKELYTAVLKGLIAVSSCKFKRGTTGHQLDALARQFLWDKGLDYAHGTGHGVGAYLNVHEGPCALSPRVSHVPLKEGMVVSVEPGVYLDDEFGIRLENLLCVIPIEDHPEFLTFETLTYVPFCPELVLFEELTEKEQAWLKNYHEETILQNIYTLISDDCYDWMFEIKEEFSK